MLSGRRSAYNWLTGSTLDTLADYTLSSDSASSLLVFEKKRAERPTVWRAVGANFGAKRLTNPTDETNSRSAGQLALTEVPVFLMSVIMSYQCATVYITVTEMYIHLFPNSWTWKTCWYPKTEATVPEGQREGKHKVCQEGNPVTKNWKGRNQTHIHTNIYILVILCCFYCSSHFCVDQEKRATQKIQREAQVTLYRSYRVGDLPDIQIQYSSLIAPLQALAQVRTYPYSK